MQAFQPIATPDALPSHDPIVQTDHADGLSAITEPGVELGLWTRTLDPVLNAWVDELEAPGIPHGRVLVAAGDAAAGVRGIMNHFPSGHQAGAQAFVEDVARLAALFSRLTGAELIDIRIDHIRHDACWKFHRDAVPLRLITTYRGPGTEIVPPARSADALRDQQSYKGSLMRVPHQSVAVFKGALSASSGIVHRSPPIAGQDISRLMVCLNTRSAVSPELMGSMTA